MDSFMVMATFKAGTDMTQVMAVVADEQARVAELEGEGALGALYLATKARQTVFLEIHAESDHAAGQIVQSLPMARWWDLDVFPLNPPA